MPSRHGIDQFVGGPPVVELTSADQRFPATFVEVRATPGRLALTDELAEVGSTLAAVLIQAALRNKRMAHGKSI